MNRKSNRPLIIVPPGLKEWFKRAVCPEGVAMFEEVRAIDPTLPGLPEFEEALSADYKLPAEKKPAPVPAPGGRAILRLVVDNGHRLER